MTGRRNITFVLLFILAFLMLGCNTDSSTLDVSTQPSEEESPTAVVQPSETPFPTVTPEPNKVLLYAPGDVAAEEVNAAQTLLSVLTQQTGMILDVKMQLGETDVDTASKVVVLLNENGVDVVSLARLYPDALFVVFRDKSMPDQPVNVISLVSDPSYFNFAAGFLSILIAPDWRVGALLPWEDEAVGTAIQEAFTNGAAYHCGRCASTYMPVALFPVLTSLPSNSAPESWIGAVTTLDNQYYLYTVYVSPEAASNELYLDLVSHNVTVVGAEKPEAIEGLLWAASINQDTLIALETNWDAIINSTLTDNQIIVPIVVSDVNEEYLSPGRMRLYDEMMDALTNGWVSPLSPDYP